MEDAKKDACLRAIEALHKLGALSDYLLPPREKVNHDELPTDSDSNEGRVR